MSNKKTNWICRIFGHNWEIFERRSEWRKCKRCGRVEYFRTILDINEDFR